MWKFGALVSERPQGSWGLRLCSHCLRLEVPLDEATSRVATSLPSCSAFEGGPWLAHLTRGVLACIPLMVMQLRTRCYAPRHRMIRCVQYVSPWSSWTLGDGIRWVPRVVSWTLRANNADCGMLRDHRRTQY